MIGISIDHSVGQRGACCKSHGAQSERKLIGPLKKLLCKKNILKKAWILFL